MCSSSVHWNQIVVKNYANSITALAALRSGQLGSATEQVAVPGQTSAWDPAINTYYSYDPAKAKPTRQG
jgi:ABC-type transport system substrate-binding protein